MNLKDGGVSKFTTVFWWPANVQCELAECGLGRAGRTKSGDERDSTRFACAGIDQFQYIKIQLKTIEYEALGNNYRVYGFYSPEPRAEVYCVRLNFNISKLVYSLFRAKRDALVRSVFAR